MSTRFTDGKGREWDMRFTTAMFGVVRREVGIDLNDLLKPDEGAALGKLFTANPDKLGKLFWHICEKQAQEKNVSPEEFMEGLDGKTIWSAFDALLDARADFCPPPIQGAIRRGLASLNSEMERVANEAVDKALESTSTPTSNGSAGSSAAQPVLTPGHTP